MLFKNLRNKKKMQKVRAQQEIKAEKIGSMPLKDRINRKFKMLGLFTTHKTIFSPTFCIFLLVQWFAFEHILGNVANFITKLLVTNRIINTVTVSGAETSAFVVNEIIPLILLVIVSRNIKHLAVQLVSIWSILTVILMYICSGLSRRLISSHIDSFTGTDAMWTAAGVALFMTLVVALCHKHIKLMKHDIKGKYNILTPLKNWFINIPKDALNHKKLVAWLTFIILIIQMVTLPIFSLLAGPNLSSPQSSGISMLAKQNWIIIPLSIFVAPVFEEIIFRCFVTNGINGVFNLAYKNKYQRIKYWAAAIFSAILFAAFHNPDGANMGVMMSRIVFALMLQYIYRRSNSITIPIAIHSFNNFIVYAFLMAGMV